MVDIIVNWQRQCMYVRAYGLYGWTMSKDDRRRITRCETNEPVQLESE